MKKKKKYDSHLSRRRVVHNHVTAEKHYFYGQGAPMQAEYKRASLCATGVSADVEIQEFRKGQWRTVEV